MCTPCPFIREKLDSFSSPSLFLNSFCLNKAGQCPNSSFSQSASPLGLWLGSLYAKLCLIIQTFCENLECLCQSLRKVVLRWRNKLKAKQHSRWEVRAVLSLWSCGAISQVRCLVEQRRSYWSFDVCFSVKRQSQSLCIEWHLPSKVLLMCPSVFYLSINHSIKPTSISLPTRSQTRNTSTPLLVFSLSFWRQNHIFSLVLSLSVSLFEKQIVTSVKSQLR